MTVAVDQGRRVDWQALTDFAGSVLQAAGVRGDVAALVARGLVQTSLRGVDSHGVRLLPHYVAAVEGGRINRNPSYRFEQTGAATGTFDADHAFGHAAGIEAMRHAMALATVAGMGAVTVRNSSHAGSAAFVAMEAAGHGFIGFSFSHANALLNTPGSTRPFFGLNPLCVAVPCPGEEPFCFDAAPSALTFNKVLQMREQNVAAPPSSGADDHGRETTDPHAITQLLPIGGYKGFGLAMVVDILCGLLTGMPVGRDISDMYRAPLSEHRRLGQFYLALRVDAFQPADEFARRMQTLVNQVRNEPRRDPDVEVMVPGDPEKRTARERARNGVPITAQDRVRLEALGTRYDISFPRC